MSTNHFDKSVVTALANRWASIEAEAASTIGTAMKQAKDDKSDLLIEVEAAGIKKKVFRAAMKKTKLLSQVDDVEAAFQDEPELSDQFDNLQLALGLLDMEQAAP